METNSENNNQSKNTWNNLSNKNLALNSKMTSAMSGSN